MPIQAIEYKKKCNNFPFIASDHEWDFYRFFRIVTVHRLRKTAIFRCDTSEKTTLNRQNFSETHCIGRDWCSAGPWADSCWGRPGRSTRCRGPGRWADRRPSPSACRGRPWCRSWRWGRGTWGAAPGTGPCPRRWRCPRRSGLAAGRTSLKQDHVPDVFLRKVFFPTNARAALSCIQRVFSVRFAGERVLVDFFFGLLRSLRIYWARMLGTALGVFL